jgi:hypothetical protein
MFVNRYQYNIKTMTGDTISINLPITMTNQMVDQNELVKIVFTDVQTQKAINPIVDYEKARYLPLDLNGNHIDKVIYQITLSSTTSGSTYADIGFTNEDITYETESFKQTFLNLNFYDSDNPLNQNLMFYITLFSELKNNDLLPNGRPKPANQIPINYVLESPIHNPRGFSEGYYLYDFKNDLNVGDSKYLYMRASFNNAKTGKSTNLMVKKNAQSIDNLIHELYTRVKLTRDTNGYYYEIDDTYQGNNITGPNNVTYTLNSMLNSVTVNLYQILAL